MKVSRLFYQIYAEFEGVDTHRLIAAVVNALAPVDRVVAEEHQIKIYKDGGEVEVKVGTRGFDKAWMQVSVVKNDILWDLYCSIIDAFKEISEEDEES